MTRVADVIKQGTLYIAGPMTGYPEYNFPAFYEAATRLRSHGWGVVSPAELDDHEGVPPGDLPWEHYLRRDLVQLLRCEAVAVLPGWRESRGARLEVHVASQLGMPILDAVTLERVEVENAGQ